MTKSLWMIMGFGVAFGWFLTDIQPILPSDELGYDPLVLQYSKGVLMAFTMAMFAAVMVGVARLLVRTGWKFGTIFLGLSAGTILYTILGIGFSHGSILDELSVFMVYLIGMFIACGIADQIVDSLGISKGVSSNLER